MWIEFKNYQEKAIVKLKQEVNELLDAEGNKICIFKSPKSEQVTRISFILRIVFQRALSRPVTTNGRTFLARMDVIF